MFNLHMMEADTNHKFIRKPKRVKTSPQSKPYSSAKLFLIKGSCKVQILFNTKLPKPQILKILGYIG